MEEMRIDEYARLDATALATLVRAGEVSPEELERAARAAIELVQPELNALVGEPFDEPLAYDADGRFAGVPFVIKDLVLHAAGVPCESGSRLFRGLVMPHDTELMSRFRRAGLATLGRTNTPELGFDSSTEPAANGATRNPWDPTRTSGGSSGGSAALVAAGAVPMAHANDGGGSIRIPAACCGLVGLKPSRGRVPLGPDFDAPLGGMGIEFAVTRTVRDCAALLDAVHGEAPGEFFVLPAPERPYGEEIHRPPGRLRIAFSSRPHLDVPVDEEVRALLESVARHLEDLGHAVVEDAPPLDQEAFFEFQLIEWSAFAAEIVHAIAPALGRKPSADDLEPATRACAEHGLALTALDLLRAESIRNAIARAVAGWMQGCDVHLLPTAAAPPWPLGFGREPPPGGWTAERWTRRVFELCPYTALFNLTGQPALSLPLGESRDGLPIGIQLVAKLGREDVLLRLAAQLEESLPWRQRMPRVHAARLSRGARGD